MVTTARDGRHRRQAVRSAGSRPTYSRSPRHRFDPATFEPDDKLRRQERTQNAAEWVIMICLAILAAFFVKAFIFQAFWIPSGSMEPTLLVGDRIVVDKISYRLGDIDHGDIIVFERPPDSQTDDSIKELVKRVIGVPGDTIEGRGGLLYRNGEIVKESYLPPGTRTLELPPTVVPEGQLWVMGDNRDNSSDSRVFGPIDQSLVEGKAAFRFWPLPRIGAL